MKKAFLVGVMVYAITIMTACHKDNEDDKGNLLGAWQVERCTASVYDADGNIQNTYDEGFSIGYMDTNNDGFHDYYVFKISSGDKWLFIDDTTVHIKDKLFTYHNIYVDGMQYIRLDAPNLKYTVITLSESALELQYLEIGTNYWGVGSLKEEITFKKL